MKTKVEIDILDGWEFVRYGSPNANEHYLNDEGKPEITSYDWVRSHRIVIKQKKPIRIVLEMEEKQRKPNIGEMYSIYQTGVSIYRLGNQVCEDKYFIWKEIKEEEK